jgi:hypothetical protein
MSHDPFHEVSLEATVPDGQPLRISVTRENGEELLTLSMPAKVLHLRLGLYRHDHDRVDLLADWIELPKEN